MRVRASHARSRRRDGRAATKSSSLVSRLPAPTSGSPPIRTSSSASSRRCSRMRASTRVPTRRSPSRATGRACSSPSATTVPGISPLELERIFQPGVRGAETAGSDGAGLGLALARRLARAASGEITAQAGPRRAVHRAPAGRLTQPVTRGSPSPLASAPGRCGRCPPRAGAARRPRSPRARRRRRSGGR